MPRILKSLSCEYRHTTSRTRIYHLSEKIACIPTHAWPEDTDHASKFWNHQISIVKVNNAAIRSGSHTVVYDRLYTSILPSLGANGNVSPCLTSWKAACTVVVAMLGLLLASYLALQSIYTTRATKIRRLYRLMHECW